MFTQGLWASVILLDALGLGFRVCFSFRVHIATLQRIHWEAY